jgi:Excalibur calcium-binding domain
VRVRGSRLVAIAAVFALAALWATAAHAATPNAPGVTPRAGDAARTATAEDARNDSRNVQTGSGDVENSNQTTGSRGSNRQSNKQGGDRSDVGSARDRNCHRDFTFQEEAQRFFERHGGSRSNNVDGLDRDRDGIACEDLPSENGAPVGGVDTGAGGAATATDGGSPLPFVLGGAGLGLLIVLLASPLRRRPSS